MITKKQFKNYIKIFNFSFHNSVLSNLFVDDINDLTNQNIQINQNKKIFKKFKCYICTDLTLFLNKNFQKPLYGIFVLIGKTNNIYLETMYYITKNVENNIILRKNKNQISFGNFCINNQQLNKFQIL